MNRGVFFEPLWDIRGGARLNLDFPPDGYEYLVDKRPEDALIHDVFVKQRLTKSIAKFAGLLVPEAFARTWVQRWRKPPDGTMLTYGFEHVVFRPEPWVVEVEHALHLIGYHQQHLERFGWILERVLSSPYCKQIICWSEAGRRTIVEGLKSEKFAHKVAMLPYAVPAKQFVKDYSEKENIKLLFIGSQAQDRPFELYGGVETFWRHFSS